MNDTEKEIERVVAALSEHQRNHLRELIYALVQCYEKDSKQGAVVLIGNETTLDNIASVNCDAMEAARLMQAAECFFNFINTKDAPPKEMFN